MQIKIKLRSDTNISLPIAHRHAVQSMIYSVLKLCPSYSELLHDNGFSKSRKDGFKLFTFSQFEGSYRISNKRIFLEKEIAFEIRCFDTFMCQLLLEGFKEGNILHLLSNELTVDSCRLENNIIHQNQVIVKMLSPVTVLTNTSDKHTIFLSPKENMFYEKLVANARRKWCTVYDEDNFELNIQPSDKHFQKLVTLFKGTYVNAWYGEFVIAGTSEVIDFLYNVGIGNKTSQGFGMFELV